MTEDKKELMKRDLIVIKKLHNKTDYTQTKNLKLIYDYAISKELLKTKLGEKYLNRLRSLYEGSSEDNSCIVCGKNCEDNPIVCNICNKKLLDGNQVQKTEIINSATESKEQPIVNEGLGQRSVPDVNTEHIPPTRKKRGKGMKIVSFIFILLLSIYIIGRIIYPQENNTSVTNNDNVKSDIEQNDTPTKASQNSTSEQSKPSSKTSKATKSKKPAKSKQKKSTTKTAKTDSFAITENKLMGKIQDALAKYKLDIGTKKGYPHIFFVLDNNTVSNVAYQTVLNDKGNVISVSVNVSAPVDDLEIFSQAVTTAIISFDSKITKNEVKSLVDNVHSTKVSKINGISYFTGAYTDDLLTYVITKASIPDSVKSNNTQTKSIKKEIHELSPLLGMTSDEVHNKLGTPLSIEDNAEYYSDNLSILYENEVAYKIILGLEERFDFTQIEIPASSYSIKNMHLRDTEASAKKLAKETKLYYGDGVFYGNTYEIEQDGYYVHVDFFTLQNVKGCPVYRIVLTRLLPVQ